MARLCEAGFGWERFRELLCGWVRIGKVVVRFDDDRRKRLGEVQSGWVRR